MKLRGVNGIAEVMTCSVGHVCDEWERMSFGMAEESIHSGDQDLDEVDVLPFVEAPDIIGLCRATFVKDQVDGPCMINDIEPISDILTLTVDGERLAMTDVIYEERDQLLGELIGTVVVGAVRHQRRHPVGIVIGTDEVVAGGLARRVRAVRIILTRLGEERSIEVECTIDFVGRDMIEALAFVLLGASFPDFTGCL